MSDNGAMWLGAGVGLLIGLALLGIAKSQPKQVCVEHAKELVPIYDRGPKHHIKGPRIGYVEEKVCKKWVAAPDEPEKQRAWPDPVY